MKTEFPKDYLKSVVDFYKKHEKAFRISYDYDQNKTAISQGYTPDWLVKEIQELKRDSADLISSGSIYICSDPYECACTLLGEIWKDSNGAMETLLRLPSVILMENPESKKSLEPITHDEGYLDEIRNIYYNTTVSGGVNKKFFDYQVDSWTKLSMGEYLGEMELYVDTSTDRLTGESIEETPLHLLEEDPNSYIENNDGPKRLDEVFPTLLRQERKLLETEEIQKYLSKVCDPLLLEDKELISDLVSRFYTRRSETYSMSEFWKQYPKIRNKVLSPRISSFSPRAIKLIMTIEYYGK